jgi:hypothetical protein
MLQDLNDPFHCLLAKSNEAAFDQPATRFLEPSPGLTTFLGFRLAL